MILSVAALAIALQATPTLSIEDGASALHQVQYRYGHPPPCGNGFDMDSRDGMCYPNGTVPRRFQTGRQYYYGGRRPVPCGNGADLDIRDGLCYPNGEVPPQFQQGRQQYYGDDEYQPRPRRRYYYGN